MKIKIIEELKSQISEKFIQGMVDRMFMGYYRYGPIEKTFPNKVDALGCLQLRLKKYEETGNTEWLIDGANFLMIEFIRPKHPNAHFQPTEDDQSPGGITHDGKIFHKKEEPFQYKKDGD